MFDWLASFFVGVASVFGLGGMVSNALIRITNTLLSLYKTWVTAASNYAANFLQFVNRVWRFGLAVVAFAEYVILVALPRAVTQAFDSATRWAASELTALRTLISGWVSAVESFARQAIGELSTFIAGEISAIRTDAANLWHRFVTVEQRVALLLTSPDALADWIAGHILAAIGRWAVARAEAIGRFVISNAVTETEWFADFIESIIIRLLG